MNIKQRNLSHKLTQFVSLSHPAKKNHYWKRCPLIFHRMQTVLISNRKRTTSLSWINLFLVVLLAMWSNRNKWTYMNKPRTHKKRKHEDKMRNLPKQTMNNFVMCVRARLLEYGDWLIVKYIRDKERERKSAYQLCVCWSSFYNYRWYNYYYMGRGKSTHFVHCVVLDRLSSACFKILSF